MLLLLLLALLATCPSCLVAEQVLRFGPSVPLVDAQRAVREVLRRSPLKEDLRVELEPGTYSLPEPLIFTRADCDSAHSVVWAGTGVGDVRVLGGELVQGWKRVWGSVYRARLGRRVYNLVEDGRQARLARHPNTAPGIGSGWLNASASATSMTWASSALPHNTSVFGLGNTSVVMATGTNYYWSEIWAVDTFSMKNRTAHFRQDHAKLRSGSAPGPHFYIRGSVGFLDEPGEFAFDSEGEYLYYYPYSGRPIEELEIVAPVAQRTLSVVGTGPGHKERVRGLIFENLTFVGSDASDVSYVFDQAQSNSVPAPFRQGLLFVENATEISFSRCRVLAAGASAVWLNHATSKVTLRGNWIEDAGHCGIFAYGFWPGAPESYVRGAKTTAADTYVNRGHVVDANVIRNVGTSSFGGAGIWLYNSGDVTISRNLINRGPRNAIGLFGTHYVDLSTTNYTAFRSAKATKAVHHNPYALYDIKRFSFATMFHVQHTRNVAIVGNDMSNFVRDSCDPGVLESYGIGPGLSVHANAIHDITVPPKRWLGNVGQGIQILFSDGGTHFSNYSSNVLYEINACSGGNGVMVKNVEEVFWNNVIADSSLGEAVWMGAYAGPASDMVVAHNIFHNSTGYCGSLWPADQSYVPPPGAPPSIGTQTGHMVFGEPGSPFPNKMGPGGTRTSCYHNYCNNWTTAASPCKVKGACTYRLTEAQLARPMLKKLDYNIVDQPLDPNISHGRHGFQKHSIAYADPGFVRRNQPWRSNWTDFVATSVAAARIGHSAVEVEAIGLGSEFGFDRRFIGRRELFRDGSPLDLGERNDFEDEDRVRGITKTESTGLLAAADAFPAASGAWAVYRNRVFNHGDHGDHSVPTEAVVVVRALVLDKGKIPSPAGLVWTLDAPLSADSSAGAVMLGVVELTSGTAVDAQGAAAAVPGFDGAVWKDYTGTWALPPDGDVRDVYVNLPFVGRNVSFVLDCWWVRGKNPRQS